MLRWLSRLSFSFLILAAVLGWEGYKQINAPADAHPIRGLMYCLAAGILGGLAAAGIRHRHRGQN